MDRITKFRRPIKSIICLIALFCLTFANAIQNSSEDCLAEAGGLDALNTNVCLTDGSAKISAKPDGNAFEPKGFTTLYVLTRGEGLVIEQVGTSSVFTVTEGGDYTIHTFIYPESFDPLTVVTLGVTTGFDVNGLLIQGGGELCAALDVAGAPITVSDPDAGTLTADATPVTLMDGSAMISATPNGDINVPAGYSSVFVLTQGEGLTIINASAEPSFTVEAAGLYTIHTFVYPSDFDPFSVITPGVTTGVDVLGLITEGGGALCASLDVPGAPIMVEEELCLVDAGTLKASNSDVCFGDGTAKISATPDGNAVVPEGYVTLYVLTQGESLTIIDVNSSPVFDVTEGGDYTIHTFIYPESFDPLTVVTLGVTTGFDVNGLLIQGGGELCAALDVAGAPITVSDPDAGTLTADATPVTLMDGSAMISATPNGDINVPAGYSSVFVLTQGEGLTIINASAEPSFTVEAAGLYTIHTFVYQSDFDPFSVITPGVTTGVDVLGLITEGGGDLCASLDVPGAPIMVEEEPCLADAGTLYSAHPLSCLDHGGTMIYANIDEEPFIPEGYQQLYVLTSAFNLKILAVSEAPEFNITHAGFYRIHSLVYDPNTLDLGIVEFGVTTGFDVNALLIQGGGEICGSLDVHGALNLVLPKWICNLFYRQMQDMRISEQDLVASYLNEYSSFDSFMESYTKDNLTANITPNPSKGIVKVAVEKVQDEVLNYQVSDISGRVFKTGILSKGQASESLDLSELNVGTYIISFQSELRKFTKKIYLID